MLFIIIIIVVVAADTAIIVFVVVVLLALMAYACVCASRPLLADCRRVRLRRRLRRCSAKY